MQFPHGRRGTEINVYCPECEWEGLAGDTYPKNDVLHCPECSEAVEQVEEKEEVKFKEEPKEEFATIHVNVGEEPDKPVTQKFMIKQKGEMIEILRFNPDGSLYWRGREVKTDETMRQAIREYTTLFVELMKQK